MKKILFTIAAAFGMIFSASAMSYEEAREQALFLTDKMAYELNLNDEQYEYCYEINLDYLMSVETADDVYGTYLSYRNADLRHILFDWQYTIFAATDYFFHPLLWHRGVWTFPIYRHYAYGHFFYSRPHVYLHYRGGHGRFYFGGGYYGSRRPHWNGGLRGHDRGPVAHRGDFGRGGHNSIGGGHTRSSRSGGFGNTRSSRHDDGYGLGSQSHTRSSRTGSFGSTPSSRHDNGLGSQSHTRSSRTGSFGNTRSSSDLGHSSIGNSGRSVTNDARTGSFSRSGNNSYSHPSSTRSFGGTSHGSVSGRSSSIGSTRSMSSSHAGSSIGSSRSGASMGGARGGSSMGSSMGGSRGGSMGGSRGGHSGRGR